MNRAKTYGLLGEKLTHSFSPLIHSMLGDYDYRLFPCAPSDLVSFLKSGDFAGINVTIPYKKTVMPYLAEITPEARSIGAVNTVLRTPNGLLGDNTDYYGFLYTLQKSGISVEGKKCLVLGSGGASATARAVLSDQGAKVTIISRTGDDNYENLARHHDAALIVNTTPVGMYPNNGASPLSLAGFDALLAVIDIIYNPRRTQLLMDAEALGIPAIGGLTMLVAQAKRANELFFARPLPNSVIEEILVKVEKKTQNIVLIGMPGCGKSTAGRVLAQKWGLTFRDTDEEIEKATGRTPAQIIEAEGEAAFRKIEQKIVQNLGRESGLVIATGGGVVTQAENFAPLRQNGRILYLARPTEKLSQKGRPLSLQTGVEALFAARRPLYEAWADATAQGEDDFSQTFQNIENALGAKKE